jgi:hypothetical protein
MSTRIVSDFRMINYRASWKEADEVDARSRMSQKSKAFLGASLGQVNHRPADFFSRQKGGAALQHYEYPPMLPLSHSVIRRNLDSRAGVYDVVFTSIPDWSTCPNPNSCLSLRTIDESGPSA